MRLASLAVLALVAFPTLDALACDGLKPGQPGKITLKRPSAGEVIAGFGMRPHPLLIVQKFHTGVDYKSETGTPVASAAAGKVVEAGHKSQYGNYVRIDHGSGLATAYGHLSAIDVRVSDCVAAGDPIGRSGSTGLSSGPQLHFEVLHHGGFIDPATVTEQ